MGFRSSQGGSEPDTLVIKETLTVDTSTLYVDSTNNRVGIGTTGPQEQLHIVSSTSNKPELVLENTNNDDLPSMVRFYKSTTTSEAAKDDIGQIMWTGKDAANADADCAWILGENWTVDSGAEEGALHFGVGSAGAIATSTLSLYGSGIANGTYAVFGDPWAGAQTYVGLGVADPDAMLEIFGTDTQLKLSHNANDYATFTLADTGDLTIATAGDGSLDSDLALDVDGNIVLDADAGYIALKDAGVTNVLIDMAGTAGELIWLGQANRSLVFKNYYQEEVARVHATSGLTSRKRVDSRSTALDLSSVATAMPYSGAIIAANVYGGAWAITLPTATDSDEASALVGFTLEVFMTIPASSNYDLTIVRGDTGNDEIAGIVSPGDAGPATGITIGSDVVTFDQTGGAAKGDYVKIVCWAATASKTSWIVYGVSAV